jgi:hypothetical protein
MRTESINRNNVPKRSAQFFLKKPFSPLDLMKIVEQVLGQQVS